MTVDCSVEICERPARTRGWCQAHYMRWWYSGDVAPERPIERHSSDAEMRYAERADQQGPVPEGRPDLGPCWVWGGARSGGYGRMSVAGKDTLVHRWAYERFVGPVPERFDLDHLRRNKACVNVAHLEAVTHQENTLRGVRRPFCKHGHEYTAENTISRSNGSRTCRKCENARQSAYYHNRKQLKEPVA